MKIGAGDRIGIFLDRDGTISEEVGYINHIDRFKLLPNTIEAINLLNKNNLLAIVVTNQAGVARGYFTEDMIGLVHEELKRLLKERSAYLDAIYYCPHHPDASDEQYKKDCECRKPKPGMLKKASIDLGIDLRRSYIIGDKISDIEMGHRVGAKGILVLTGYGKGEYEYQRDKWKAMPVFIAEDMLEAVRWIIKNEEASVYENR